MILLKQNTEVRMGFGFQGNKMGLDLNNEERYLQFYDSLMGLSYWAIQFMLCSVGNKPVNLSKEACGYVYIQ